MFHKSILNSKQKTHFLIEKFYDLFSIYQYCFESRKVTYKLKCETGQVAREDNMKCLNELNDCKGTQRSIHKNYFGFFLEEMKCSNNSELHLKEILDFENLGEN